MEITDISRKIDRDNRLLWAQLNAEDYADMTEATRSGD
jgi:hypothetical protein